MRGAGNLDDTLLFSFLVQSSFRSVLIPLDPGFFRLSSPIIVHGTCIALHALSFSFSLLLSSVLGAVKRSTPHHDHEHEFLFLSFACRFVRHLFLASSDTYTYMLERALPKSLSGLRAPRSVFFTGVDMRA